jgi:hypothetical protein
MPVVVAMSHHDQPIEDRSDSALAPGEVSTPQLEIAAPGGFPAGVQVVEDGEPPRERTEAITIEVRV